MMDEHEIPTRHAVHRDIDRTLGLYCDMMLALKLRYLRGLETPDSVIRAMVTKTGLYAKEIDNLHQQHQAQGTLL